jgi:predicted DNA-binding transcriptional regulator AlpA
VTAVVSVACGRCAEREGAIVLLTGKALRELVVASRVGIWRITKDPTFPRAVLLPSRGGRRPRRRWRQDEYNRWVESLARAGPSPAS